MLLRYPGGKSRGAICKRLVELIKERYDYGTFGETFFGGGGITFKLLQEGVLESIIINDFDKPVADLWTYVIQDPDYLCSRVKRFKPSVDRFLKSKRCILGKLDHDLGFDMLVVNRLSHAGRGVKAGPQGGFDQKGKYKIDCRWNPDTLCKNIQKAFELLNSVSIYGNKCWNVNYERLLSRADFHYFDPPYWEIGQELYNCSFTEDNHRTLYGHLRYRHDWILSYNNHPSVVDLYSKYHIEIGSTAGNGGEKKESEIIICS